MSKIPTQNPTSTKQNSESLEQVDSSHSAPSLQEAKSEQSRSSSSSKASSPDFQPDFNPLLNVLLCWLVLLVLTNPSAISPSAVKGYARSLIHVINQLPLPQLQWRYSGSTDPRIVNLRRAIIGQESGANYRAVNPHSGALGYGQLMPANVPVWTKQALGRSLTPEQFLNDPNAQIATIDYKLQQYWYEAQMVTWDEDEIVRRIASKWYSGNPNLWKHTRPQTYNGHAYPSIANYTYSVLLRYREQF